MERDKILVWLSGEIKTPPFGERARKAAGFYLRIAQKGMKLSNPPFDPMPEIGKGCYDLHIKDAEKTWRIIIHVDDGLCGHIGSIRKETKEDIWEH